MSHSLLSSTAFVIYPQKVPSTTFYSHYFYDFHYFPLALLLLFRLLSIRPPFCLYLHRPLLPFPSTIPAFNTAHFFLHLSSTTSYLHLQYCHYFQNFILPLIPLTNFCYRFLCHPLSGALSISTSSDILVSLCIPISSI